MLQMRGIFSPNYNAFLERRDNVRKLVKDAIENLNGCTLYGEKVDTNNPEELIAALYVLYRDYELFHERM